MGSFFIVGILNPLINFMAIFKKIIGWILKLFGHKLVEDVVEKVEEKLDVDLPEDTIIEFANKILPDVLDDPNAKLWAKQEDILKVMAEGDVFVEGDRGTGKSLILILHAAYTLFKKPESTVVLRTVTLEGSKTIVSKILSVVENVKDEFGVKVDKYLPTELKLSNGSRLIVSNDTELNDIKGYKVDLFLGDEIAHWEDKAIEALEKKVSEKVFNKINLVTTDWDNKANKIVDILPEGIKVVDILFLDKDKDLGEKARYFMKELGKDGFLKEFGTLFK